MLNETTDLIKGEFEFVKCVCMDACCSPMQNKNKLLSHFKATTSLPVK